MAINQYESQPDLPPAAVRPGIGERLARLTAGDDKLHVQALRIGDLSRQLGNADLALIQQDIGAAGQAIGQLGQRVLGIESSAGAVTAHVAKLDVGQGQLHSQVSVLQGDVAALKQAHAALVHRHDELARAVDHRIDDAFKQLSHVRHDLAGLAARVDDCCGTEGQAKPSGKRSKSN
jgi:hypothetical protein